MRYSIDPPALGPAPADDPIGAHTVSTARRSNYLHGGRDNFKVDRDSATRIAARFPTVRLAAWENRRFLHRAVTTVATELGIRQFLDIGAGLPTTPSVHHIARQVHPDARVVYVDHDPVVASHCRALLLDSPRTAFIPGDLRQPAEIMHHPDLHATLDLDQPVAVLLAAVAHYLTDDVNPYTLLDDVMRPLAAGSALVLSHATFDLFDPPQVHQLLPLLDPSAGHGPFQPRTRLEIDRFFTGLTYLRPGLVPIVDWRPGTPPVPDPIATPATTGLLAAVAYRP